MNKLIAFAITCMISLTGFSQNENPYEAYKTKWNGKSAPNFKATTIIGEEIELNELKNKVVLLNFWFTTCSGCKLEYAGLQTLKDRFRNQDEVILVSNEFNESSIMTPAISIILS